MAGTKLIRCSTSSQERHLTDPHLKRNTGRQSGSRADLSLYTCKRGREVRGLPLHSASPDHARKRLCSSEPGQQSPSPSGHFQRPLTLSRTTSLMGGRPSGFWMQAGMNWKSRRNSRSYCFFPSVSRGFHCSVVTHTRPQMGRRGRREKENNNPHPEIEDQFV